MDIYKVGIAKIELGKKIERLNVTFKADIKSVEKLISFILARRRR